jgi:hypothetical protein
MRHFEPQGQDDRAKGGKGEEVSLIHRHTPRVLPGRRASHGEEGTRVIRLKFNPDAAFAQELEREGWSCATPVSRMAPCACSSRVSFWRLPSPRLNLRFINGPHRNPRGLVGAWVRTGA